MRRPDCAGPGCARRSVHLHHVVYEQEVRRRGGSLRDGRNLIPLCMSCHFGHHGRSAPLPLRVLRDEMFEFAAELLGAGAAYEYLRRRYAGQDPRLDTLVA